jgi:hypothetical protein
VSNDNEFEFRRRLHLQIEEYAEDAALLHCTALGCCCSRNAVSAAGPRDSEEMLASTHQYIDQFFGRVEKRDERWVVVDNTGAEHELFSTVDRKFSVMGFYGIQEITPHGTKTVWKPVYPRKK